MKSLFIIEDDLELAQELSAYLSEKDFHVCTTSTGTQALLMLQAAPFDLCLLDVGLPDCSGFDLCRKIRKFYHNSIIMLTAYDSEDDIVRGLQSGADDYVSKPFSLRVLQSRIDAQLRRNRRTVQPMLNCLRSGSLRIDLEHRMIFSDGAELPVSSTEFALCEALLRNWGQILPRDLLLNQLWDNRDHFIENNTLSVHISRLRKKLGLFRGEAYIETVKGIGYRWNVEVRNEP